MPVRYVLHRITKVRQPRVALRGVRPDGTAICILRLPDDDPHDGAVELREAIDEVVRFALGDELKEG